MAVASRGMVHVASSAEFDKYEHKGPKGQHRGNDGSARGLDLSIYDPSVDLNITCGDGTQTAGKGTHRHHHNFDQIRYMISGYTTYDRQRIGPGSLQYIPESTYYGPQMREDGGRRLITFQFPGQSLKEFFAFNSAHAVSSRMKEEGIRFENDFAIHLDGYKHDGWECMWEHQAGRKIEYAPQVYPEPIYFDCTASDWEPSEYPGISFKQVGRFNVYGPNMGFVKLDAGATLPIKPVSCMQFRVVVEGEAEADGQTLPVGSRIYEGPGSESLPTTSKMGATLLTVQMGYRGKTEPAPMSVL